MAFKLNVNGKNLSADVEGDTPLLWVLRDTLGVLGPKYGCGIAQCGYCQAGQIMSATALLTSNAKPTDADIDEAMAGNVCRCATYTRIRAAIKLASGQKTEA